MTAIYPQFSFAEFFLGLFAPILAMFEEKNEPGEVERGARSSGSILDDIFGPGKGMADLPDDDPDEPDEGDDDDSDQDDDEEEFSDFDESDDEDFDHDDIDDDDDEEDPEKDPEENDDDDDADDSEENDDDSDDSDDEDEDDSDDDSDEDEDEDSEDESIARKQAKERGRKLKILQQEYDDLELEAETAREEVEALKQEVKKLSTTRMTPDDDPTFRDEKGKVLSAIKDVSLDLPRNGESLAQEYGPLYDRYAKIRDMESESDRREAYNKFQADIAMQYSPFEEPLDELQGEERREALDAVKNVVGLLKEQSARTEELIRLEADLTKKAQEGQIAVGVQEYEKSAKALEPVLEDLGKMSDEELEEASGTLEGMLATVIEKNPDKAKELKKAKQTVLDIVLGPKPLTQAQIDSLVEKGQDVSEAKRRQAKRVDMLRKDKLAKFVTFLALEDDLAESVKTASELAHKKSRKEKALVTLNKARRKKKVKKAPAKKKAKPQRASDRPNSAFKIFDD